MHRKKKIWVKAEYWATKASVEVAQAAFAECDALGIEIDDGSRPEGINLYSDDKVLIIAYFEAEAQKEERVRETLARFLKECGFLAGFLQFSMQEEEDWQGNFLRSYTSFKVEPGIFIVPSFDKEQFLKQYSNEFFIEMDPENAFGTGQHQTTKLCLKNIHAFLIAKKSERENFACLDVGTGSGILAILMKKLSAGAVLATETDEDALITAQKNALKNEVSLDFLLVNEEYEYTSHSYDFIVANILAPVLISMKKNLCQALKSKGHLILSGILLDQAADVISSYEDEGMALVKKDILDDWCALIFEKS